MADTIQIKRLTSLDALRGIAACVVVLSHCYLVIPEQNRALIDGSLWSIPFRPFHNGQAAVIIFFVLSGYVLSLPYLRGTQLPYLNYVVRRVCRIYIPFAASIFLALFAYILIGQSHAQAASHWFDSFWSTVPTVSVVLKHFLMLGAGPDIELNPIMWTLIHEMRISLLFPLLILLCRNTRIAIPAALLLLVAATKILAGLQSFYPAHPGTVGITFLWTAQMTPYFITGILLSKHREQIHALWQRLPKPARFGLIVAPLFIFAVPFEFIFAKRDALYGLGAAALVVLAIEIPRLRAFLNEPIPQWLGRISYSIYLIHLPIMLVVVPPLIGRMPFGFVVAAVLAAALAAATVLHALVEVPAIKLGHRLTRRTTSPVTAEPLSIGTASTVIRE